MAEQTDINKNKSAVDILIDSLRLDLKEAQKFKNIDAAYFGGKAGTSVPVPKKFTAEQTISFMRKFPSTYPLADENAYFGIARALTTESPELFDIASFDAYEKKKSRLFVVLNQTSLRFISMVRCIIRMRMFVTTRNI